MLEPTVSCHNQWCIEIENPTKVQRNIIRSVVTNLLVDSKEYELRAKAGAFLQCDSKTYILVEFWLDDFEPFVEFVNQKLEKVK